MTNQELYAEEQRLQLIALNSGIKELKELIQKQIDAYKPPVEDVKIEGRVEVINPSTEMSITNLEALKAYFDDMAVQISSAIEKHATKPVNEVSVKNQPTSIAVSNQIDHSEQLQRILTAIKTKDLNVIVEKSEVVFPTSPKQAIPVRLSDGKSFYNAIFQAMSSAVETDPLVGYQPTDIDESGASKYYGFTKKHGYWYIMREVNGAYRYITGAPLANGGGLYTDAWNNRANLTYSYFYEVF